MLNEADIKFYESNANEIHDEHEQRKGKNAQAQSTLLKSIIDSSGGIITARIILILFYESNTWPAQD